MKTPKLKLHEIVPPDVVTLSKNESHALNFYGSMDDFGQMFSVLKKMPVLQRENEALRKHCEKLIDWL